MELIGFCFRRVPSGINIFKISKRPHEFLDFQSVKTVSQTQENGKNIKWSSLGSAFAESLRGIKHSKRPHETLAFESVKTVSQTNNWKNIK